MENLNEGKKKNGKKSYMMELAEIDAQSAIVAMEAKIAKLEEMAVAKEQRLSMVSEDENLSELISKSAVKEMQKEIKEIRKMQEKLKKVYEKKNGKKMPEMVDEDEAMEEMVDPTNMDLDKAVYGDDAERDPATGNIKEDELDEAHCNTEEDDTDSMNEEFLRMQKLAGVISEEEYKSKLAENKLLKENKIAQAIRDEAEQEDSKVGAAIFNKYAKKIESAPKEDYRKILTSMERELIDKHPDTFDGDDDIVASFMAVNEEVSPQVAADKAIKTLATKLEKSPEMDKLAAQVAKNPKLMAQLEKAVKDAGVNVELAEDESGLDMADMKKMALNLAKKSKSVNEKQENLDGDDGSLDVGLGMASFVGGGSLGAAFGSAIVSAVPAVASIFAGPALLGAAAGVGLFLLARKAYLMANPDL